MPRRGKKQRSAEIRDSISGKKHFAEIGAHRSKKSVPRKFAQISKTNVQRMLTARRAKEKAADDLKSNESLTRRRAFFA